MEISVLKLNNLYTSRNYVSCQNAYNKMSIKKAVVSFNGVATFNNISDKRVIVRFFDRFSKLQKNSEEIISIGVNSIGTAVVAPIIITTNPFDKEKKEIKTYSAWQYPFVALVVLIPQIFITKSVIKTVNKVADSKHLDNILNFARNKDGKLTEQSLKELQIFRDRAGIVMSLLSLPVTCFALKWIYPKFMKRFFPELSKSKDKGERK